MFSACRAVLVFEDFQPMLPGQPFRSALRPQSIPAGQAAPWVDRHAPGPARRAGLRPHGIQVNAIRQRSVLLSFRSLHHDGFISVAEQAPPLSMPHIEALRVCIPEPLHSATRFGSGVSMKRWCDSPGPRHAPATQSSRRPRPAPPGKNADRRHDKSAPVGFPSPSRGRIPPPIFALRWA